MADNLTKYFRTHHLPWSEAVEDDDIVAPSPFTSEDVVVVTLKMDGENCLEGSTIVETEYGNKTIQWICENKYSGKVKCYNTETNVIYWENILNWFIKDNDDDFFEITLDDGSSILLTENHLVWCTNVKKYKKVRDLTVDDEVLLKR